MNWTGKITGGLIGLFLGKPIFIIIGLILGHLYDIGWLSRLFGFRTPGQQRQQKVQSVFFDCTFTIMGHIAKCDGRVSENEIRIAQNMMDQMNLDANMKREAIRLFNEGKSPDFNLDAALSKLKRACWYRPSLLRFFLETQIQMAYADGKNISDKKRQVLQYICQHLGVSGLNFSYFENRYRAEQHYQQGYQQQGGGYQQRAQYRPGQSLNDAYKVLGVSSSASDAEIKKAYRRLMSQHHPDKLIAKGLPPEMIKMATQKTQQIKKAYEQICAARK